MKGLLLKDWYLLIKRLKFVLLIMLLFACIPGYSISFFAVLYAAFLPMTALAYDERSKWNDLAVMMPYSVPELVTSKYLLGIIGVFIAGIISSVAQFLSTGGGAAFYESIMSLLVMVCLALIFLSINMPIMFRLGVEKGRLIFMLLICGGTFGGMYFKDKLITLSGQINSVTMPILFIAVFTVIIVCASILISIQLYKSRQK